MARLVKFEGSRVPGTWYHTGDFVITTIDAFEPHRVVFDRSARSVIQDDCHATSILAAGIKSHIALAEHCAKEGIDQSLHQKAAKDRLIWMCEFLGVSITSDEEFRSKTQNAIATIWTDAYDRI